MGFKSPAHLRRHCLDHMREVGASTCVEYLAFATNFMTKPKTGTMHEYTRSKGDCLRYDESTQEFGLISNSGVLRSYFKPNPAIHGLPSNLDYFGRECLIH